MLSGISDPGPDGLFLVPFDAYQTADPAPFRHQGQGFDNLIFRRATAIEDCPLGLCEGIATDIAFEALTTCFGLAKLDTLFLRKSAGFLFDNANTGHF
jgi:hypothetical protein